MRALCWHGKEDIRCDRVPDPGIEHPRDAIVKVTSTAICGSDLHLYEAFIPGMKSGDIAAGPRSRVVQHRARPRRNAGAARKDFTPPRDMPTPEALRPFTIQPALERSPHGAFASLMRR